MIPTISAFDALKPLVKVRVFSAGRTLKIEGGLRMALLGILVTRLWYFDSLYFLLSGGILQRGW